MKTIKFYRVNDDYGEFSNFAPFQIHLDHKLWPTVEHYYQANKFTDSFIKEKIRSNPSPMNAANEGRKLKNQLKEDWNLVKENVMKKALFAKFTQHHYLKYILLETDDSLIIEHTQNDFYWGDGGDGTGKNRLGVLLMVTREAIKKICADASIFFPPWIVFEGISIDDMFWRMGIGENYLYNWSKYYFNLNDISKYQTKFPEPEDWKNFYS